MGIIPIYTVLPYCVIERRRRYCQRCTSTLHAVGGFYSRPQHITLSFAGVAIPMVKLTEPDGREVPLVLGPEDYDINATFECTAEGTTLWRVDNYELVDRDQYAHQGLFVLDHRQGYSELIFKDPNEFEGRQGGFPFVFEALDRCYFTIYCLAIKDSLNVDTSSEIYANSFQTVASSIHCSEFLHLKAMHVYHREYDTTGME